MNACDNSRVHATDPEGTKKKSRIGCRAVLNPGGGLRNGLWESWYSFSLATCGSTKHPSMTGASKYRTNQKNRSELRFDALDSERNRKFAASAFTCAGSTRTGSFTKRRIDLPEGRRWGSSDCCKWSHRPLSLSFLGKAGGDFVVHCHSPVGPAAQASPAPVSGAPLIGEFDLRGRPHQPSRVPRLYIPVICATRAMARVSRRAFRQTDVSSFEIRRPVKHTERSMGVLLVCEKRLSRSRVSLM